MGNFKAQFKLYAIVLAVLLCAPAAMAQYQFKGVVVDAGNNEPIPYASIYVLGSGQGAVASVDGRYTLDSRVRSGRLKVTALGYADTEFVVRHGATDTLAMPANAAQLGEVVVKKRREKYEKKGNPAVEFIKKVRSHMHDQDPYRHDYYTTDKYEHLTYGVNDLANLDKNAIGRLFRDHRQYLDTSDVTGKTILPLSLNETYSTFYYRKSPESRKQYVRARQHVGLDEDFDPESIKRFMDDAFREIDIYGNNINFMQQRFISPLSNIGVDFYKYYLNDTIVIDGEQCIELDFVPFNTNAFGFIGRMYFLVGDTSMFLKKIVMNVPKSINLNYISSVYITQNFMQAPDGTRLKTLDDMTLEIYLPGAPKLYARKKTHYSHQTFATPDADAMSIFGRAGDQILAGDATGPHDWEKLRPVPTRIDENVMEQLIARFRSSKFFYWAEKVVATLFQGYIGTGKPSKFDIGPLNTIVSGDKLEGLRLRLGGMSTANLSKHWFFRGHVAYGFDDEKWKYHGEVEYSFNEKKYHNNEWPIHSVKVTHDYDIDKLGQHYLYTSQDNAFLLLKRKTDDKINYLRQTHVDYKLELANGFSIAAGLEHDVHEASKFLPMIDGEGRYHNNYHEAGFNVTLRYAPGEKFFQTRSYRFPINIDNPIIMLSHTIMPKGLLGSNFTVNKTEAAIQKRFWFSAWGYTDIILKGAKIWSRVPYPDLLIPNANLSYTIQPESYTLMNPMEFMNDQYLSWDVTYWLNGALLNYVPLVKKLKLREVVSFRGLWGSLSDRNDPAKHPELYVFPTNALCQPMGDKPYMELGVGLDNILKCLRLDYVWRLSYRDTPGTDRGGLRLQLHVAF